MKTIDLTPTWSGMLPTLVMLLDNGYKTRNTALAELANMAKAADLWNAHCAQLNQNKDTPA